MGSVAKETLGLEPGDFKALEQTRQRLAQISSSIGSLKADVFASNALPNLDSLRASADILQKNIDSFIEVTTDRSELFSRVVAHPTTNYPGRTQELALTQLLRKKPEPDIATIMDEGRSAGAGLVPVYKSGGLGAARGRDSDDDDDDAEKQRVEGEADGPGKDLRMGWNSSRSFCKNRLYEYVVGEGDDPFTEEERQRGVENVRTGLKRTLEYDEDEDEEEEDDDVMMVDRPPPPPAPAVATQQVEGATLEAVMRATARGDFVTG
ncbi:mediator of RNA polymerase II transcription complex subunit 8-domain-containing protein [Hypoxylon crocopeplum]|nr:mediator of RNA polymerase II transcription complex subunit 8-domain-containing protein [Hypoxylon crocopeplum]